MTIRGKIISMSIHHPEASLDERFQAVHDETDGGLFASEGPLFRSGKFGRDQLETCEEFVEFYPEKVRAVLLSLAALQGTEYNWKNEEEPGKIIHEHRRLSNAKDEESVRIFWEQDEKWDGNGQEVVYYGSADSTVLFMRLGVKYAKLHGEEILYEKVVGRDGMERTFGECLLNAKDWTLDKINASPWGLIEYKRTHDRSHENQVWKDSKEAYVHTDGSLANYDGGIAAIEVQGYAYDALKGINELFGETVSEDTIKSFGQRIIDSYWLEEEQMFAQAIDRDEQGNPRHIRVPSSNSGLLLDSELLLYRFNVHRPEVRRMVQATVDMLMGPDFLTEAGIRCRSLKFDHLMDFADYHGSYAVWFKETSDIMRGLLRHGYDDEAKKLAQAIVDTTQSLGEYFEFVFVDENGKILNPRDEEGNVITLDKRSGVFADKRCNIPEPGQAWSIGAFVSALRILQASPLNQIGPMYDDYGY